jgi:hypothetical protein
MARIIKNPINFNQEAKEIEELETIIQEERFIELEHCVQFGTMFVGDEIYQIVNGKIKVKHRHIHEVLAHIKAFQP